MLITLPRSVSLVTVCAVVVFSSCLIFCVSSGFVGRNDVDKRSKILDAIVAEEKRAVVDNLDQRMETTTMKQYSSRVPIRPYRSQNKGNDAINREEKTETTTKQQFLIPIRPYKNENEQNRRISNNNQEQRMETTTKKVYPSIIPIRPYRSQSRQDGGINSNNKENEKNDKPTEKVDKLPKVATNDLPFVEDELSEQAQSIDEKIKQEKLSQSSHEKGESRVDTKKSSHRTPILNVIRDFVYPQVEVFSYTNGAPYIEESADIIMDTRPFSKKSKPLDTEETERKFPCGGEFGGLSGIVSSPDYPYSYPSNIRCTYTIKVPPQYKIGLRCDEFSIQPGELDCENDFLQIYRSGDLEAENANKYCGEHGLVVESVSNTMALVFKSDNTFRYRGFMCRYRALNPDGSGAEGIVSSNTTAEDHTIICTGPGDDGWAGKCGVSFTPGTRIVGGTPVDKHQFPWMAAILKKCGRNKDHYCHICGGTVIDEQWILTGAHCLYRVPAEEIGVLLGDHNLYTLTPSQKFFKIEQTYIHPDFNVPSPLNHDVALIKFPQKILFSRYIAPVCMPPRNVLELLNLIPREDLESSGDGVTPSLRSDPALPPHVILRQNLVGRNVSVYGWGTVSDDGERATALRSVKVEILENAECHYLYGLMTDTMMCTSGENAHGPCMGDSGSPAQIEMVDGRWVQIGVLAFGAATGCEVGYPSGNVLLPVYVDWIEFVTGVDFSKYN